MKFENNEIQEKFDAANSDSDKAMLASAEEVKQLLKKCLAEPGADITITVNHNSKDSATAELYDHAAFVDALIYALNEFQAEL